MMRLIIWAVLLSELIVPAPSQITPRDGLAIKQPIVRPGVVNWWMESAEPGQGDNVVLYGHSTYRDAPNVFAGLHRLGPGAIITVTWRGADFGYIVTQVVIVDEDTPEQRVENGRFIQPVGRERLTLVTCAGDDRLIVISKPRQAGTSRGNR